MRGESESGSVMALLVWMRKISPDLTVTRVIEKLISILARDWTVSGLRARSNEEERVIISS